MPYFNITEFIGSLCSENAIELLQQREVYLPTQQTQLKDTMTRQIQWQATRVGIMPIYAGSP